MAPGRLLSGLRRTAGGLGSYLVLSLAIAIFVASILVSLVRVEEDRRVRYATVNDGEWNVVQAVAQLEKFAALLERFMRDGSNLDVDELYEQYEVMWSRFHLLGDNPGNGTTLAALQAARPALAGIEDELTRLEPTIQELKPGDQRAYGEVNDFLRRQREWLIDLTTRIHAERVNADAQLGNVGQIYERTLLFLALTVLSTGVLILQLVRAIRRTDASLGEARAARTEAHVARLRLQAVVDSVPAMIAAWDNDERCLFANRLYAAFHGLAADRMVGRTVRELGLGAALEQAVGEVVRAGLTVPFAEHAARDADRCERVLLSTQVPVRGGRDDGAVTGVVDVSLDITDRKQREVALTEARNRLERQAEAMRELAEEAQRADRAKSRFLAMMSHEIRTPMNALLGFAELLASSQLRQEERRYVDIIRETGRQLLGTLNDILDFTKIEADKVEIERVPFRLDALLRATRPVTEMLLAEKAVAFELHVAADVPAVVRGDQLKLKQVLTNLLSNAAKFTSRGRVRLEVRRESAVDAAPDLVRFAVSDTGVGIEAGQLGRLFQVFSQAEQSTTRRFGGTGLGLAICRQLVERMGGRIGVESAPGEGSTFWFVLPLEPAAAADAPDTEPVPEAKPAADTGAPAASTRLTVLVVDDVRTNLQLLQALVRRAGHQVVIATDGAEAVRAVESEALDLVLMDVNMPVMDGLEATRRIRRLPGERGRVPIVALTANAFVCDVDACREAGMDDHLAKPIDSAALAAVLACHAASPRAGFEASRTASPVNATPDERDVLDHAALDELALAVGVEQVTVLFRQMAAEAAAEIAAMRRAAVSGDIPVLERSAHRLAGLASSLGAGRLSRLAEANEISARSDPSDPTVASRIDDLGHALAVAVQAFESRVGQRGESGTRPLESATARAEREPANAVPL